MQRRKFMLGATSAMCAAAFGPMLKADQVLGEADKIVQRPISKVYWAIYPDEHINYAEMDDGGIYIHAKDGEPFEPGDIVSVSYDPKKGLCCAKLNKK